MTPVPRCAVGSEARHESLMGSASTVTRFLLVEDPGPWGVEALRDARMPAPVKQQLAARARKHRVRLLLIRRHGRSRPRGLRCFAVSAAADDPWVQTTTMDDAVEVLGLDLAGFDSPDRLGIPAYDGSLFLVCTHGRHDPCCAERGRPLARALSRSHPEQTWECSHIGGDRFAGNLVILPRGLYYGRVDAVSGPRIAAANERGLLDLAHLRGRVTSGFAAQAAEWYLRAKLDLEGLDDVRLLHHAVRDELAETVFAVADGTTWRARVRAVRGEPEQLSCRSVHMGRAPTYELLDIVPERR